MFLSARSSFISLKHFNYQTTQNALKVCYRSLLLKENKEKYNGSSASLHSLSPTLNFSPQKKFPLQHLFIQYRNIGFFNKLTAEKLWNGVISVSNAGSKRGRGRGSGAAKAKNLNRGQFLGVGEDNMVWPGLNSPIIRGKEIVKQQRLPKDENRLKKLIEIRDKMGGFRAFKLSPIERGWSGRKLPGKSVGPPPKIGDYAFEGFDTKVLEAKFVHKMTGNLGRKRRASVFLVTGNKNGLAGIGLGKAPLNANATNKAKVIAGQRLMYIDRYDEHTVYHDFFCKFMSTRIFVKKKPKGYGLVCHRAIKEICQMIGIKDLHAKIEGSINVQNITKAFFMGLLSQRSHQKLSEEKGLYVVKVRPNSYPEVIATPTTTEVRSRDEVSLDEELDFNLYIMDGKVEIERKKFEPFFTRLPSYESHLKKVLKSRNHLKIKRQQMVEYGEVISFLTEKHPECRPGFVIKDEDD